MCLLGQAFAQQRFSFSFLRLSASADICFDLMMTSCYKHCIQSQRGVAYSHCPCSSVLVTLPLLHDQSMDHSNCYCDLMTFVSTTTLRCYNLCLLDYIPRPLLSHKKPYSFPPSQHPGLGW